MGTQNEVPVLNGMEDPEPETIGAPTITKSGLKMVIFSLCMASFLAALDVTIVATALPTIAAHLHTSASEYTWIGSSYNLASTASIPLWAKMSDIWGRKPIILLANAVFLAGSLLAALSVSVSMLICGRILQGIGGGGLLILISVIIGDLVSLRERAKYYGFTAIVWAVASGLGPVLGGIFTQTVGWRWCFFINLPFDFISLVILAVFLKLETPHTPLWAGLRAFDWVGSIVIVGGTVCFLYGLESGAGGTRSWNSAFTWCLILSGLALLGLFFLYEWKYAHHPIVPIRVITGRSRLAPMAAAFCHSFVFIAYDYFLPLYFQVVLGASPIYSGLYLFALVLPLSAFSAGTGMFVNRTGHYRVAIWFGLIVMTIGTGLFIDFEPHIVWWKIILFQIIAGVGAGPLFQSPLIALQSHLKTADVAAGTSAFTFLRNIATSMSVVIGGVVLQKGLGASSLTATTSVAQSGRTHSATEDNKTEDGRQVYTSALRNMWIFYTVICGFGVLVSFLIVKKDLHTQREEVVAGIQGVLGPSTQREQIDMTNNIHPAQEVGDVEKSAN